MIQLKASLTQEEEENLLAVPTCLLSLLCDSEIGGKPGDMLFDTESRLYYKQYDLECAVSAYIERIQSDRSIVPSFNTFYEYMRDDYRKELAQRDIKVEKSTRWIRSTGR